MNITAGGFVIGTPQYMAPEQLMGGQADARSDIYSAAVVLNECLAGKPPFPSESPSELLASFVSSQPVLLRELDATIPARLETALHQQLRLNPADRFQSARALADVLHEIEHDTDVATLP
jgi:serine/threonine protein kinase